MLQTEDLLWRKTYCLISPGEVERLRWPLLAASSLVGGCGPTDIGHQVQLGWGESQPPRHSTALSARQIGLLSLQVQDQVQLGWGESQTNLLSLQATLHAVALFAILAEALRYDSVEMQLITSENYFLQDLDKYDQVQFERGESKTGLQCTIIGTELVFTLVLKVWRLKTKS